MGVLEVPYNTQKCAQASMLLSEMYAVHTDINFVLCVALSEAVMTRPNSTTPGRDVGTLLRLTRNTTSSLTWLSAEQTGKSMERLLKFVEQWLHTAQPGYLCMQWVRIVALDVLLVGQESNYT